MKRLVLLLSLILLLSGCTAPAQPGNVNMNLAPTAASPLIKPERPEGPPPIVPYDYTLTFAGDVSLADGAVPTRAWQNRGVEGCFSQELLDIMRGADLFTLNSEFSFTDRGTRIEKNYNFRADPSRISVYDELGVDLAVLANNHVFDYGEVGLADTLTTFRDAGIPYVGAGENLDEASATYYADLGEITVAYIAGCRVEWTMQTRGATEELSGVFRTAEGNDLICRRIAEAKEKADFVVVYIHWGMEGDTWLEPYQLASGKQFIDAGADVVVGDHPHCLQAIEYYNGKPIFYSLGNFWFSSAAKYTTLLNIELTRDDTGTTAVTYSLTPAWTEGGRVTTVSNERAFYNYMESLSDGVTIDDNGIISEQ